MKKIALLFLTAFCSLSLLGQASGPVGSDTLTFSTTSDYDSLTFSVSFFEEDGKFGVRAAPVKERSSSSVLGLRADFELSHGDLLINYGFGPDGTKAGMKPGRYFAGIKTRWINEQSDEGAPVLYPNKVSGDLGEISLPGKSPKQIVWEDVLESLVHLEGELELVLTVVRFSVYYQPRFAFKKDLPYGVAAATGAIAATAGVLLLRNNAQDAYDLYLRQRVDRKSLEDAEPFYQDANSKRHRALGLIYAGAGLLLTDGIMYIWKKIDSRRPWREKSDLNRLDFRTDLLQLSGQNYLGFNLSYKF